MIRKALNKDGIVTFWSATNEAGFVNRLSRARFHVNAVPCKAHERAKRLEHVIYVAKRDERPPQVAAPVTHVRPSRFTKPHKK
jgi:hypothetical protein